MRVLTMGVVGVCVLTLVAPLANAELITIQIEGVVDTVEDDGDYLEDQIHVGDIITGWYTYDTDTPDSNPAYEVAHYQHTIQPAGITLHIGGVEFKTDFADVDFLVGITNDGTSGGLHDSYWIVSHNNELLPNGASVDSILWNLENSGGTALHSTDLPLLPPNLYDWQVNHLRLDGERGEYMIHGQVLSAVPEPCTLLFLGLGVLSVIRKVR